MKTFHVSRQVSPRIKAERGFSLVELLTVMAIILILGSVGLTMETSGGKVGNAGLFLDNLVVEARENSISKNVLTALIEVTSSAHPEWNNRLFILAQLAPGSATWMPVSKGEMLPSGTLVDPSKSTFTSPNFQNPPSVVFQGVTISGDSNAYQIFLPDGSLETTSGGNSAPPMLWIVSGVMNSTSGITFTGNQANYCEVLLNSYTGLPKLLQP